MWLLNNDTKIGSQLALLLLNIRRSCSAVATIYAQNIQRFQPVRLIVGLVRPHTGTSPCIVRPDVRLFDGLVVHGPVRLTVQKLGAGYWESCRPLAYSIWEEGAEGEKLGVRQLGMFW